MIIKGAKVFTYRHGFENRDIYIHRGRIANPSDELLQDEIIKADGLMAIPGLVDIHTHGAVGYDYCDCSKDELRLIAEYEAQRGVLAVCPTTMSLAEEQLNRIIDKIVDHQNEIGADFVGINMEGPFISPKKVGAQDPKCVIPPNCEMFERLQRRSHYSIKLLDMAPEVNGAKEFIEKESMRVKISFAHSIADYDTALWAFHNGISHITHLFNAMQGIGHRNPGPVIAAIESGCEAELIADSIHVHPSMVRLAFEQFGNRRIILISDSMMACGLSDGDYTLGGQKVRVCAGRASMADNPDVIAGSATSLFDCMRNAVLNMGIPIESAIIAASLNPSISIGIDKDYGSLEIGHYGNVILMDQNMNIVSVIKKGRKIL